VYQPRRLLNIVPKVVIRQRNSRELNSQPLESQANALLHHQATPLHQQKDDWKKLKVVALIAINVNFSTPVLVQYIVFVYVLH